jgi:hypothetical protein
MFSYNSATLRHFRQPSSRYIPGMRRITLLRLSAAVASRVRMLRRGLLAALWAPGLALAALGQDAATIDGDLVRLQAQHRISQAGGYTVHELQLAGGTVVREYLAPNQQVFAVSWTGPSIPDLQQLLGVHYARYQAAAQASGRSRRGISVQEPGLVVRAAGHSRAFHGVAYLPSAMPAGFDASQIQ